MRYLAVLYATLGLGLGGCAQISDRGMRLVATPVPAYAVMNANNFSGTALLHVDRTGTLDLVASNNPKLSCMGQLRYTATSNGVIQLQCSDGNKATLSFTAVQETRGYASGAGTKGAVHLTFGLDAGQATAYLGPLPEPRGAAAGAGPESGTRP